jgi:DNA polymerase I-like protein with 3'-5' exonuclease and polymerase domains
MALFSIPERAGRAGDIAIAKKANSKSARAPVTVKSTGGGIVDKINAARALVEKTLGQYADLFGIIQDEAQLQYYIGAAIDNGIISIDTETTGLDPLSDELVGICIYTPGFQAAYIPVNHKSYITGEKIDNQLSVDFLHQQFNRIAESKIDVIMFNAPFDIRFLRSGINVYLTCTWDCYLAARLLNENEGSGNNNLKALHSKYCTDGTGASMRFADYFEGISFELVPIKLGYLYAARDALITFELYEFQKPFLTQDHEDCIERGLQDVAWVFHNIEMPCVQVIADMEDTGVDFDMEFANLLYDKYHTELVEKTKKVYEVLDMYSAEISAYRTKFPSNKLSDPINLDSPTQIAILLYDIMGIKPVDKDSPRGTGVAVLTKVNNAFTKALLEYREVGKLINTYIDKLPNCVNEKDGRIHCKFNQYGADTGRMSSSDPNLQNIPSHNKDIRKMFKATDGYVLMSSDFSQQEPKALAAMCRKQGDPQMYNTFMEGKDLYSEIASKAFNKPYEECKEFRPDGTTNKEGKARRTQAKSILLGVLYGRGTESIAEQLGTTAKEAQSIKDSVFRGFPAIKQFEEDSIQMSKDYGFVTTVCGRKRRLPSMMLPDYEIVWKDGVAPDDDPLAFDVSMDSSREVPESVKRKWLTKIRSANFYTRRKVIEAAEEDGISIIDHTKDKDTTKVVNARIQGSAADLTKLAMIELHRNERLRELGFRMLIPVHDEIIAECPEENVKECSELLASTMSYAAEQILEMPIKCDVEITKQWYGDSITI